MKKGWILSLILLSSVAFADQFPWNKSLYLSPQNRAAQPVKLSPGVIEMQGLRSQWFTQKTARSWSDNLPSEVNLGMNGVPVLDQGKYPTCVTFAVTAAIDAAINKGDYISQLCLLQLSTSLAENSYYHSLWLGSSIRIVLDYIAHYGIMSIADQKKGYCNNVKTYPLLYNKKYENQKLSVASYHAHSEDAYHSYHIEPQVLFAFAHTYWVDDDPDRILTLGNNSDGWVTPEASLAALRKSLSEGNRVVVEFLFNGVLERGGNINEDNDAWFASNDLKSAFASVLYFSQGDAIWYLHDAVIFGYNDKLTVGNAKGESQTGVFYLRNSWGEEKLEYMTYDFFKLMAMEGISINAAKKPH